MNVYEGARAYRTLIHTMWYVLYAIYIHKHIQIANHHYVALFVWLYEWATVCVCGKRGWQQQQHHHRFIVHLHATKYAFQIVLWLKIAVQHTHTHTHLHCICECVVWKFQHPNERFNTELTTNKNIATRIRSTFAQKKKNQANRTKKRENEMNWIEIEREKGRDKKRSKK